MKYVFSFIFGAAVGAGVTLVVLHKEIKKQLAEISKNSAAGSAEASQSPVNGSNSNDEPFTVSDNVEKKDAAESKFEASTEKPVAVQEQTYVRYENLIRDNYGGEVQNPSKNIENIQKREEEDAGMGKAKEVAQEIFDDVNGNHWTAIDDEEFDNNPGFNKDKLVFYEADRVLATENGTVIENGYLLIGNDWEEEVGHYGFRTAYIRNNKSATDYEIYVEACAYADEWGTEGAPLVED